LHAATGLGGQVRLVLRNPEDDTHYTSQGATVGDVFGPDERANRGAEDGKEGKQEPSANDLTEWLSGQQDAQHTGPAEPAVPALPKPTAPRGKMVVIYGSELMQVDFPGDGGLPTNPMMRDSVAPGMGPSTQLTGGAAPAGGNDAAQPNQGDDQSGGDQDGNDQWNDDSADGKQPN
jgi:hypothetical protein